MSNLSQQFDKDSGHRFKVKKEFAGSYTSCCGMQIESHPQGGWNVTWPGVSTPDEWTSNLKDAKSIAEHHHGEAS